MGLEEYVGAKVVLFTLSKQDPVKLANKIADLFDTFLDGELGEGHSKDIQTIFVPWFDKFANAFNSRLLENQE